MPIAQQMQGGVQALPRLHGPGDHLGVEPLRGQVVHADLGGPSRKSRQGPGDGPAKDDPQIGGERSRALPVSTADLHERRRHGVLDQVLGVRLPGAQACGRQEPFQVTAHELVLGGGLPGQDPADQILIFLQRRVGPLGSTP